MSKLYVTKNNRRYERKRDNITISLTHAPSTVFSTTQLVLEFHIGGTGVSLMWYWSVTHVVLAKNLYASNRTWRIMSGHLLF